MSPSKTHEAETHFVIIHTPGPKWKANIEFAAQPGITEHVAHYRKFFESGKLDFGGPFLDDRGGGMMITHKNVSESEAEAFAQSDPAILSGVLRCEIREWLAAIRPSS